MATTILDAVSIAAENVVPTLTVSSGSNRRVFVLVGRAHGSDANPPTSCTLGGVSMTTIATADDSGAAWDVCWRLFGLVESQLSGISGNTISLSGGAYTYQQVITWTVQGAHQTNITTATSTINGTSNTTSLARAADSYTLAFTLHDYGAANNFSGLSEPSQDSQWRLTLGNYAYGEATDTERTASFAWTHANTQNNATIAINIPPASTSPSITSTSDDTPTDGSTLTLTVTNAGATQGTGGVTANGTGWTETSWSATSIAVTVALGSNRYNTNVPLQFTTDGGQSSNSYNVQIQPASGKAYFNLSGTPATTGSERITAIPDLDGTEQLEVSNVVGGSISDVTLYNNATWSAASGVTSFDVRAHNGTEWGSVATQNLIPDTTAPTLTSATIGTNGTTLTLVFDEVVTAGADGSGGFSFSTAGGAATATYASGDGTDTRVYTLSRTVKNTEGLGLLDYTQPGDGIQDDAGNVLASFADEYVTNNSTQNDAPTAIALSSNTLTTTAGDNATVGQLSATDADYGDTHTFTKVAGTGDTNNALFDVSGTTLIFIDPAAAGAGVYSVRIRATDSAANTVDAVFTVTVSASLTDGINHIATNTGVNTTSDFTCEVGDLLIGWASRDGSNTSPTRPSGWEYIRTGGANTLGYAMAYKFATSTTESSGTWPNATSLAISQFRMVGNYTFAIGASNTGVNSTGTNAIYPAVTLEDTSGNSWIMCGYAHRSPDISASDATATGLTVRAFVQDATDTLAVHTAERVTTWPGITVTYTGTSAARRYVAVEIKATPPPEEASITSISRQIYRNISRQIGRTLN